MDFRLTFEEGQAWLFVKLTSYLRQGQCRSGHQRRSKHLEKATRCFHAWPLQDLSLRLFSLVRFRRDSRLTLKKVKSDCFRRSMPIRTSEKVSVEGNSWQVEYSPLWRLIVNLEKDTRCFQTGLLEDRPIPSWISDWLLEKVKRDCLWSSHLTPDKVNADQDIREGQNISKKSHGALMLDLCRIFHYAWFRWYDSAAIPDWLWRRSRVIVSEGLCRSGHQRISMLRITLAHFDLWECQGWTSKKQHGAFKLDFWKASRFRHGLPTDFGEGQARLFEKVTSYLRQGRCRSGHRWRSVLRVTADKQNVDLCEGQGWTSKKTHGAFMLDFWKTARFRHGFPTDFWRRSSVTVCEAHILHLTKSMPIKISEKVKTSRKSHTVLSCLTSAESFITSDFVGTIPLDSVRFRRLHPTDSTTIFDQADDYQEKASLSVSEQVPHEKSRSSSRKSAAGTVLTVFGSSAGHSFGKPQRDCVSETSLLSQLASAGVGICVHNRWTADDRQKRPRWKHRSIHERSRKSS